ncbi:MAG TPA: hypothetical protein PLS49_04220 [Candidatus Woesebacteria bacterium]|nr:hypothetical protein [Candidatus Woesebacteria bacterium]
MALTEAQKRKIEEEELYRAQMRSFAQPQGSQKHGVPAIVSLLLPGVGQMIKGQVGKGILILIATGIGYLMLVLPGIIIHIWQVVDAYNN